ncbi:hypothetical protein PCANC_23140 [Puccinia coronata f. sp. avenae]|uniref:DNA 3'-5' helicase n=1 Tax=Puccinia coronata f. sp. avenae TaxID=200324 RepID=A0A2N5SBL6_9BASI|nr:hypothetical protein PCANC_23140 [Puccinia coronata f. sp. avenae]
MVYSWGLVDSGTAKNSSAHKQTQDRSLFRPLYGDIGGQLNATEGVPILMLSATCRPVAIEGILKSLFITEDNIIFVRGELPRPKIRILRVVMKCSLKSNHDLLRVIEKVETVDKDIAPTLIYAGTRNATLQVMKVVNRSRKTPTAERNPCSSMMHQYHSNTGGYAKVNSINQFTNKKYPYVACTMALGLGQNWKQKQRNGKNKIDDFEGIKEQTDDVRMDALAMTPVCLRIAFSLDNLVGHIPMSTDDIRYIREQQRKIDEGFPKCQCSNCLPEEAIQLYD